MSDADPPAIDSLVGQTLAGRYRLTRKVGEGGMGAVYEAVQEALGRTVAVKILRDKYLDRPEVAQRLVKEAQLASSIEHEHIVRILDSGATGDGRPFVVMEHLRGESLAERIVREGALPESLVIELALQTAGALGAAHARSIIHRDVKPENVFLVARDGDVPQVKIVDFGISKSLIGPQNDSNLRLTATGMVLGTPLYMSPEQARGDDELDHRIDVYALGVILYEALTGEVPFRASNYLGIISQVLGSPIVPPRELRPELHLSAGIEQVVLRAMSRRREDRYPTMAAFADDLVRVRDGRPLAGAPASAGPVETPRALPFAPRALWPLGAALGVGAVVLLTLPYFGDKPALVAPSAAARDAVPAREDAAPIMASLSVDSEPTGAAVFIDDRSYGATPLVLQAPRGKQRLSLRLAGYEDATAEGVLGVDERVNVKLTPLPAHGKDPTSLPSAKTVRTPTQAPTKKAGDRPTPQAGGETLPNPY